MKYFSKKTVQLGDRVKLWDERGEIVAILDIGAFSKDYPEKDWRHLQTGALVKTDSGEIIRFVDLEDQEDVELYARSAEGDE